MAPLHRKFELREKIDNNSRNRIDTKEASGASSIKHYLLYKAVKTDLEEEVVFDDNF